MKLEKKIIKYLLKNDIIGDINIIETLENYTGVSDTNIFVILKSLNEDISFYDMSPNSVTGKREIRIDSINKESLKNKISFCTKKNISVIMIIISIIGSIMIPIILKLINN